MFRTFGFLVAISLTAPAWAVPPTTENYDKEGIRKFLESPEFKSILESLQNCADDEPGIPTSSLKDPRHLALAMLKSQPGPIHLAKTDTFAKQPCLKLFKVEPKKFNYEQLEKPKNYFYLERKLFYLERQVLDLPGEMLILPPVEKK